MFLPLTFAFCIFGFALLPLAAQSDPKELSVIEERLQRVNTNTPRETMASFMRAMNKYREGTLENDPDLMEWINDAVRCLDTRQIDGVASAQSAKDSAIYLKEVIDRAIKINLDYIPDSRDEPTWTLKDTEIKVVLVEEGDRAGEFLFSKYTVARAREFYDKVDDLPYVKGSGQGAGFRQPWLERSVPAWTRESLFDIAYWQWIGLFIAILCGLIIKLIVKGVGNLVHRLTRHTETDWDDTLVESEINPVSLLASSGFWWASLYILRFEGVPLKVLTVLVQITLSVSVIWVFYALADTVSKYLRSLAERTSNTLDDQIVKLISRTMKAFVIIMGVMIGLENLGIEVYQLLAGLGIGGLAIALAAKDSLSNFFASITIMIDRPFQVGHWIKVGNSDGTVEDVGFRSTKIRTFYNSLISIPNSEIANTGVDNMGLRQYRRVKTFLGVTYDTPSEKIEAFLEGIKNIIKANPHTRKDYFHVVFNDFGTSSLDIMVYFFLSVPNWSDELVERQNVLLEIIRLAEELKVEFAFPTQTLHIMNQPGHPAYDPGHNTDHDYLSGGSRNFAAGGSKAQPAGSGLFIPPHRESS
ncbi:MAG: mechanosensitive ion channel family protein [Verrucomicrobiota bacterium]